MKGLSRFFLVVVGNVFFCLSGVGGLHAAVQTTLAILPFASEKKDSSEALRESLVSELVRTGKTAVIEREAIGKILKEQSFQQSGAVETEEAVKLGKILSVRYVVIGSFREVESSQIWMVNVVNVESAQIVLSERVEAPNVRQLLAESRKLADKIILALEPGPRAAANASSNKSGASAEPVPLKNTNALFTPFQLGFVGPIQLFPRDFAVVGLSVCVISSENREVRGVDAGLILIVPDLMVGVQAGLLNFTDRLWGVQTGLINKASDINALQAGLINVARVVRGVQVGLVNFTERLYGVQIGLVNIATRGPGVPFMIAINIGF